MVTAAAVGSATDRPKTPWVRVNQVSPAPARTIRIVNGALWRAKGLLEKRDGSAIARQCTRGSGGSRER